MEDIDSFSGFDWMHGRLRVTFEIISFQLAGTNFAMIAIAAAPGQALSDKPDMTMP